MPLFGQEDDLISITVHYISSKNSKGFRSIKVIKEDKAKAMLQDPAKAGKVESVTALFKQPTWSAQQTIFSQSNIYAPEAGKKQTDWSVFSDLQLKTSIVSWDIMDADGRELPVTPELIDALPAPIANELLVQYREAMEMEEDEGNE